jgi:hypothetical protein
MGKLLMEHYDKMFRLALWLSLALLVATASARATELKMATWNLEGLLRGPSSDSQRMAVETALRRYAEALNADVIALEGLDRAATAARIFPADRYAVHLAMPYI